MGKYFTLALLSLVLQLPVTAQVRQEYLYNTAMPYGTLDIRTQISATTFYYLDEGKTFSYREKAPGVKTESFVDMTSWDSSPYKQGNLRKKDGTKDSFIMNYRLLPPLGYNASYEKGYPLIVIMHGAIERGNCYYSNCYHANWQYDPNVNSPPAPTDPGHQLLNNDAQLVTGGKEHLDARNRAGSRLPDDPSMPSTAFPGFVLMPQMLNVWDSLVVEDVIRIVRLHCEKYNIDPNRIYIHGLSIGGYATYEAIKRAPWLFAAALPMSAVTEAANIFRNGLQDKVAHIPLWIFQGAGDTRPSPAQTESLIAKFKSAGALIRYTKYANVGHRTWEKAYYEPDFFSWMLGNSKTNLHVRSGITAIDASKNVYPVLMLAAGFFAYQWEKDGVVMQGAASNNLTVKSPGIYRARFSRVANPGANDWEPWSSPVTITGDQPQ
ncbi:MAG TPA: prolyl oligopeptidase family serine peptidase, partial [Chryseosolibacter sp.]|nr:prolyl oligopeptidase family serine peptidase [Chryseosolibacter sp.]